MAGNTPIYGFPYPEPTDLVADYPALGQQLAEDIEDVLPTIGGLAPATPTSIANSGGTATLSGNTVTFSGVSSVSLNGVFTGDYDNYRVVLSGTGSTALNIRMRMRVSSADNTTSNYVNQAINGSASTASAAQETGQTSMRVATADAGLSAHSLDVFRPALAATTACITLGGYGGSTPSAFVWYSHHNVASAFDGFTLVTSTGTMTGTVSVYGYKK